MGNVLKVINNSVLTVIQAEVLPSRVSMRRCSLKAFGGDLPELEDLSSRKIKADKKIARKDKRDFRPWQVRREWRERMEEREMVVYDDTGFFTGY